MTGGGKILHLPAPGNDMGTRERRRKAGGVYLEPIANKGASTGSKANIRARVKVECLLDEYHLRLVIGELQHQAGMMFRSAWLEQAFNVRVKTPKGGGFADLADYLNYRTVSERRLSIAAKKLKPYHLSVVIAVCGMDERAGSSRRLKYLRDALDELIDIWKLK